MIRRLWSLRRAYPAFVVLSFLTISLLLVWPLVDFYLRADDLVTPFGYNDFGAYSGAVDSWLDGGPIYVQADDGGYHGSYLYPPITLLLFYPFTLVDFSTGAILLGSLSLLLLWSGLILAARSLGYTVSLWEAPVFLLALGGFQPALRDFKWAQISTLMAALLCYAFYTHERGERAGSHRWVRYASGGLTTLSSVFKLFVATSGAHLLRDRYRFTGAMVTAGVLACSSLLIFGIDAHQTYVDVLLWGKGWGETYPPAFWDTSAAYHPLYVFGDYAMALRVGVIVGVIALTLATRTVDTPALRRGVFALGVAIIPLSAPSADSHDLVVLLLPALILLAIELDSEDGYPALPVLAVLLVHLHRYGIEIAIQAPGWLPFAQFVSDQAAWFQPAMWATVLLVGLAAVRVGEHASVSVPRLS